MNRTFETTKRNSCRICGRELETLWDLGTHCLTGHFSDPGETVPEAPMVLTHCTRCTLVQLQHDYSLPILYGENYGYRSGLNISMVKHLSKLAHKLEELTDLSDGDSIIDIGGNDGTLLEDKAFRSVWANSFRMKELGINIRDRIIHRLRDDIAAQKSLNWLYLVKHILLSGANSELKITP